jgi:hypothetical protein
MLVLSAPAWRFVSGITLKSLTVFFAQKHTTVSSVVTEFSSRKYWFLDMSLEINLWILRDKLY